MCGIYMIQSKVSGKFYIGGTKDSFHTRFALHRTALNKGKGAPLLQAVYDEVGLENLKFIPLQKFPPAEVGQREREAIERLRPALNVIGVKNRATVEDVQRVPHQGREVTIRELSRLSGVSTATILARVKRGMAGDDLVAPPHKAPRKQYVRKS